MDYHLGVPLDCVFGKMMAHQMGALVTASTSYSNITYHLHGICEKAS